ncbi:2-oxo acid dehydrogenase subunit E2 [Pelolinea submarina]|uniref:2-oxoacid dehydrogenase/acyltransferase catalytic subunit n=1 Tax=Pelolinea submarina TaxID=913107 RepID=A0A347ZT10_9CHLR|nr:2-oxo acid dehydrogenase subunit E2 [Pelolinea submarina]REG10984.1 2-oxoacid dehydrogenase/acyltransferase catalytic subunit [Pelolinea submarina]BBB48441.1 pyruvate dehydrogenase E2 component, dihydrolipoamide acetyltransferase [Pelolinea submarina]
MGNPSKNKPIQFHKEPFSLRRKMVTASASAGRGQNNIHAIFEVDISKPRRFMKQHQEKTGEKLSLTAFVITCLSRAVVLHPKMNSFRRGNQLIILENVTISAMVERNIKGESIPEPFGVGFAQDKSYIQIHNQIREIQAKTDVEFGGFSGTGWVKFIPGFLYNLFIKIASRNLNMMDRYGAVAVTAFGMFANEGVAFIPLVSATVGVTVGSIINRVVEIGGKFEMHEHLCLTASFNHDIVDGAPAARFVKDFAGFLQSDQLLRESFGISTGVD